MVTKNKRLMLIDGYGFVFRAYHSMPPLTRSDGTPVGAVYGFTNMLWQHMQKHNADYIAVVLDAGSKTFRNDMYDQYKANRPPAPEDLIPQFPLVREAAMALNLPVLEKEGYEADDIIATYARLAKEEGIEVQIVSSDKDLMQLVDDGHVAMYDPLKSKHITSEQVVEKFGVTPDKVLDTLALMGDSSDNIPGVPGIGLKTAAELINQYGNLEDLLARASEIKQNKRRENLIEFKDQALLSKELVTLHEEVPLEVGLDSLQIRSVDEESFIAFLQKQQFKNLLKRFEGAGAKPSAEMPSIEFVSCKDISELSSFCANIKEKRQMAYMFWEEKETLKAFSLVFNGDQGAVIAFDQEGDGLFASSGVDEVINILKPLFCDPSIHVLSHHISKQPIATPNAFDDVMSMSYVLGAGRHDHDLASIGQAYEMNLPSIPSFADPDFNKQAIAITAQLPHIYTRLLHELVEHNLLSLYRRIEHDMLPVIQAMQHKGVYTDEQKLIDLSKEFSQSLDELEKEIHYQAGEAFNIASPKQLGEILFEKMGIEGGKQSKKTGAYATGAEILESLSADGHIIAELILHWRQLSKLKSTYTDALQKQMSDQHRIHTELSMASTSTGRLSSKNPNLQNIPIRTKEGNRIREAFVAPEGRVLISADYSQVELRLLAHVADIPTLKEAFHQGHDIHKVTASQIFNTELVEVTPKQRRQAKTINFGIIYGMSVFGLAHRLGISRQDAKQYMEQYFTEYPGIKAYMERTIEFAKTRGYVQTIFGRRCYVPGINDKIPTRRQFSERAAINAPLQGAAADIIKRAMIKLHKALLSMDADIILQVHDELLIEVRHDQAEEVRALTTRVMEQAANLSVPLVVDANIGRSWAEIH